MTVLVYFTIDSINKKPVNLLQALSAKYTEKLTYQQT